MYFFYVLIHLSFHSLASYSFSYFQRDINLQQLVFNWLMDILEEMPKGKLDYDKWISDGSVLTKGTSSLGFALAHLFAQNKHRRIFTFLPR